MLLQRKKERLEIADAIDGIRRDAAGSCSTRNRNCGLTSTADSAISMPASKPPSARVPVERERSTSASVTGRRVCPSHQRRKNLLCRRPAGLAGCERKIRRRLGVSPGPSAAWSDDDRNGVDRGLNPRMPERIEARLLRLTRRFRQERWLQKCDADRVRTGPNRNPRLEVLIDGRVGGFALRRFDREHLHAPLSSSSSRSWLAEAFDMLVAISPQSNLISYSPSSGNVADRTAAGAIGRPSTWSSWVRSGLIVIVSPPGERPARPTASRLIFSAADT